MSRFFLPGGNVIAGNDVIVGDDHVHIKTALRLKSGDTINVFDGQSEYIARILSVDKTQTVIEIIEKLDLNNESACKITLYQALPKADKLELIVQKCTELGVCSFVPFVSERCIGKLGANKLERLRKIVYEATKQSRRQAIPALSAAIEFNDLLLRIPTHALCVLAWEERDSLPGGEPLGGEPLKSILSAPYTDIAVVIGSEGGFSRDEVQRMKQAGAAVATLGKRILRTETAGMALCSIILYEMNEMA